MFRLLALAVVPLALLAFIEGALRIAGLGYSTRFFQPVIVNGEKVLRENDEFSSRFFPRQLVRRPVPFLLPAEKPADTVRIFVFGESAAMGDPDPGFSFSRVLQVLLEERFPDKQFEVLNLSFTAINSHVLLPAAREAASHQADFWLIYMGNNEVKGPFGPGTVFQDSSPARPFIRANLFLKQTRIGQWLDAARSRAGSGSRPTSWQGLEMFLDSPVPAHHPALERVYDHFEKNMAAMVRHGHRAGAQVIAGTVAGNLRQFSPFLSVHGPGFPETAIKAWDRDYGAATRLSREGRFDEALAAWEAIEDAGYAEVHYRLGECYLAVERPEEAVGRFGLARDHDALRFRTDARLNQIIRSTVAAAKHARLVDAEMAFGQAGPGGSPGYELFLDHVHPNFEGNYLLGRLFAEAVVAELPGGEAGAGEWATVEECARALGWTPWNEREALKEMMNRMGGPPFTLRPGHEREMEILEAKLNEIERLRPDQMLGQSVETARAAAGRRPNDRFLHENLARVLHAAGDSQGAIAHLDEVTRLLPHYAAAWYNIGHIRASMEQYEEALPFFVRALELRPDYPQALNGKAVSLEALGQVRRAEEILEKLLQDRPDHPQAWLNLGLIKRKQREFEAAASLLQEHVNRVPSAASAHLQLALVLQELQQREGALEAYTVAAQLGPQNTRHLLSFATKLAGENEKDLALKALRSALEIQPELWQARYTLAHELAAQRQFEEAAEHFRVVIRHNPEMVEAHLNLGVALANQRRVEEARLAFERALQLAPGHPAALRYLDEIDGKE